MQNANKYLNLWSTYWFDMAIWEPSGYILQYLFICLVSHGGVHPYLSHHETPQKTVYKLSEDSSWIISSLAFPHHFSSPSCSCSYFSCSSCSRCSCFYCWSCSWSSKSASLPPSPLLLHLGSNKLASKVSTCFSLAWWGMSEIWCMDYSRQTVLQNMFVCMISMSFSVSQCTLRVARP